LDWKILNKESQIEEIAQESYDKHVLIFKHSTTCPISSIAKLRLQDNWSLSLDKFSIYYLDLLAYRSVSNKIAEHFQVHHESPQVIVLKDGAVTYDVSHLDISIKDVESVLV